ncbi:MAG: polyprenyl synthetase family protein [Candidatus Omnitrophica bacterium]|nr:polyprenyl synthetase family protein [Candidatus Omnitrophota bacterium]
MEEKEKIINKVLGNYIKEGDMSSKSLLQLMNYSLLGKGKRIRPMLVLTVAEVLGKNYRLLLPAACGIEMIHVSSLILDDLPCMDDALTRRGKPALHRVKGDANAILASYALLMEGVGLIVQNAENLKIGRNKISRIIKGISGAVGLKGISLGQFLDLEFRNKDCSLSDVKKIHYYKTASLFAASLEISAIISGANEKQIATLKAYGQTLGLAFQIKDDLLGYEKKPRDLGKLSLKGEISPNYARLLGKENSERKIKELIKKACRCLDIFGKKAETLREFTYLIENREK